MNLYTRAILVRSRCARDESIPTAAVSQIVMSVTCMRAVIIPATTTTCMLSRTHLDLPARLRASAAGAARPCTGRPLQYVLHHVSMRGCCSITGLVAARCAGCEYAKVHGTKSARAVILGNMWVRSWAIHVRVSVCTRVWDLFASQSF
jgi:hypothetical protein